MIFAYVSLALTTMASLTLSTSPANLHCVCNTCFENLKYCTTQDGFCYEETFRNDTVLYGCLNAKQAKHKCVRRDVEDIDSLSMVGCCNSKHWCNAKIDLQKLKGQLVDAEFESNPINRSQGDVTCYCNECNSSNVCSTSAKCYTYISVHNDNLENKFGCMKAEELEYCPSKAPINKFNHFKGMYCCDGDWCNIDADHLTNLQTSSEFKIRFVRLETVGRIGLTTIYHLRMFNQASKKFKVTITMLGDLSTVSYITNSNKISFNAQQNVLYTIIITPFLRDEEVKVAQREFHFAKMTVTEPSLYAIDVTRGQILNVVCSNCSVISPDCHSDKCSFNLDNANPIWVFNEQP